MEKEKKKISVRASAAGTNTLADANRKRNVYDLHTQRLLLIFKKYSIVYTPECILKTDVPGRYYIADFYFVINGQKNIFELDGEYHRRKEILAKDEEKDRYLCLVQNIDVYRFSNDFLFNNVDKISLLLKLLNTGKVPHGGGKVRHLSYKDKQIRTRNMYQPINMKTLVETYDPPEVTADPLYTIIGC